MPLVQSILPWVTSVIFIWNKVLATQLLALCDLHTRIIGDPWLGSNWSSLSYLWKISYMRFVSLCMLELDHKESSALKNWCFRIMVLKKTLENPLDSKGIKPINPKRNQPWIFTGKTDAEAEAPMLWPPDLNNWLTGKDPDVGKDWGQEEKWAAEVEMDGWHQWLNGHEFEQIPEDGDGQVSMECCSPWGSQSQTWLSDWTIKHFSSILHGFL